jgi:hypothetical protein
MKLQELLKEKKPSKSKKMKLVITETQFKALAKNVLNEQEQKTIKNTHLIKAKFNAKKN